MTAPGIQSLPLSASFLWSKWIYPYSTLEASLLLGGSYALEQREHREEENHQNQSGWSLHQTIACSVCSFRHKKLRSSRKSQPLSRLKEAPRSQKAIITIARILLTAIHNILKKNETYSLELYRKGHLPPTHRFLWRKPLSSSSDRDYLITAPPIA